MKKEEIREKLFNWLKVTTNNHALMHKSYQSDKNYENLEILGDSYLNFYTVSKLYSKFSSPSEITKHKKGIVSNENLSRVFKEFNLMKYVKLGDSLKPNDISDKIEGDFIESIIGALYLDSRENKEYESLLNAFLDVFIISDFYCHVIHDYKSIVYEKIQRHNIEIITNYTTFGPDHALKHRCELIIKFPKREFCVIKTANTKKQAVQECCKEVVSKKILPN